MNKFITKFIIATLTLFLGITINVSAQTVYITKTGDKFHKSTCKYLSKSKISISLTDAEEKDYTACKICKPSKKSSINEDKNKENENESSVKPEIRNTVTSKQCSAKTNAGAKCKRNTTDSSGKCWQHQ